MPLLERGDEPLRVGVRISFERRGEIALRGAERNHHVRLHLQRLRRFARHVVRKGRDDCIGPHGGDGARHLVDQLDERTRIRALPLVDRRAGRAAAPALRVILAHTKTPRGGIRAHAFQDLLDDDAPDLRIGETRIRSMPIIQVARSIRLDGVVFRMVFPILLHRQKVLERVTVAKTGRPPDGDATIRLHAKLRHMRAIEPETRRHRGGRECAPPARIADRDGRLLRFAKALRHLEPVTCRKVLNALRKPFNAAKAFQKLEHAIAYAPVVPGNAKLSLLRFNRERAFGGKRIAPQNDSPRRPRSRVLCHHRQLHAR